jgi:hypothetical protein
VNGNFLSFKHQPLNNPLPSPHKNMPLQDYIATLTEFIKEYNPPSPEDQTQDHDQARAQAQEDWARIAKYVVANCVDRMHARVSHWSSLTLIIGQANLRTTNLLSDCERFCASPRYTEMAAKRRKDESLFVAAKIAKKSKSYKLLMQYRAAKTTVTVVDNIDSLIAALEAAQAGATGPAYSKQTCIQFHHFYVDTLIGYLNSLTKVRSLKEAEKEARNAKPAETERKPMQGDGGETHPGDNKPEVPDTAHPGHSTEWLDSMKAVYHYADLLWRITTSRMFDYHSQVLVVGKADLKARPEFIPLFLGASGEAKTYWNDPGPSERVASAEDEGGVETEIRETDIARSKSPLQAFKSWVSLMSSHLIALHVLAFKIPRSPVDSQTEGEVHISLIAVSRRRHGMTKNGLVLNWHTIIEEIAAKYAHLDAKETIKRIQSQIDDPRNQRFTGAFGKTRKQVEQTGNNLKPEQSEMGTPDADLEIASKSAMGSQVTIKPPQNRSDYRQDESPKTEHSSGLNRLLNLRRKATGPLISAMSKMPKDSKSKAQKNSGRPPGPGMCLFSTAVHCEAGLAALQSYPVSGCGGDAQLLDVVEVIYISLTLTSISLTIVQRSNNSLIGVSKLCCPVCYSLLKELRGEANLYMIQGRHDTVCPVDLPGWLPNNILQKMVDIYESHLFEELLKFNRRDLNSPYSLPSGYSRSAS